MMGKYNEAPFKKIGKPDAGSVEEIPVPNLEDALYMEATKGNTMSRPDRTEDYYSDKVARFLARKAEPWNSEDVDKSADADSFLFTADGEEPVIDYDMRWLEFDQSEIIAFLYQAGPVPIDQKTHAEIGRLFEEIERILSGLYRVAREKELESLYEELVPPDGPAETVAGEIVRATAEMRFSLEAGKTQGGFRANFPAAKYLMNKAGKDVRNVMHFMLDSERSTLGLPLLYGAVLDYIDGNPELKETPNDIDFETGQKFADSQIRNADR